jgi:hypothetical protein
MMVARALGINDDPVRGGIDEGEIPPGIVHLVFPGSTDAPNKITQRTAADVARDALALFEKFRTVPLPVPVPKLPGKAPMKPRRKKPQGRKVAGKKTRPKRSVRPRKKSGDRTSTPGRSRKRSSATPR